MKPGPTPARFFVRVHERDYKGSPQLNFSSILAGVRLRNFQPPPTKKTVNDCTAHRRIVLPRAARGQAGPSGVRGGRDGGGGGAARASGALPRSRRGLPAEADLSSVSWGRGRQQLRGNLSRGGEGLPAIGTSRCGIRREVFVCVGLTTVCVAAGLRVARCETI